MTALQNNAAAERGEAAAITQTVAAQSRHIVSTTITTFGGFLPLILAGGGFWPPFAMAIAGGVLLSTVVSFYFVPLGRYTLYEHATRIGGTEEAEDLGQDVKVASDRIETAVRDKIHEELAQRSSSTD